MSPDEGASIALELHLNYYFKKKFKRQGGVTPDGAPSAVDVF